MKSVDIDKYIAGFPDEIQRRMERIREIVHEAAPEAQEKISWRMPTFFVGRKTFHFAGHKRHIGIYPGVEPIAAMKDELSAFHTSKGGIQLPNDKPLPEELLKIIVKKALA